MPRSGARCAGGGGKGRPPRCWLTTSARAAVAALFAAAWVVAAAAVVPTGISLPPLDVPVPHYGGAWASASSLVFLDLFKHAAPFEPGSRGKGSTGAWGWLSTTAFPWSATGYPLDLEPPSKPSWYEWSAAAKIGVSGAYYPAGAYVLLYDGVGRLVVSGDATAVTSLPGRMDLQIAPATGFVVRIVATNVTNPVHNIRVVPAAYLDSYADQLFHPRFLDQISGFSVLRFYQWQKIWGDERNAAMQRDWGARVTPAHQSQVTKDGVAIELMVALANKAKASPFFSLPVASNESDPYSLSFAAYVVANLDPSLTVYIEYSSQGSGWMTSTLAINTARHAKMWRAAWAAAGDRPKPALVVTAQYAVPPWLPYFDSTFKALGLDSYVDALTVVGSFGSSRVYNSPTPCHYEFNSPRFSEDPANANITLARALALTRSSVIHSDLTHTRWAAWAAARGKKLIAFAGGPDWAQMQAPYYASRMNYQNIIGCTAYPCSKSLYGTVASAPSGTVTFGSQADRDAAAAIFRPMAEREYALDELLMQAKLRSPETRDFTLDHLARWEAGGGGAFIAELPVAARCDSAPGSRVRLPDECVAGSSVANAVYPEDSPVFQALKDYQAGRRSALPRSGAPPAPPPACGACKWGTCAKGACVCYAGWKGAACDVKTSRPNECNAAVGINLQGLSDWAHSWTFTDVMKTGRAWILQYYDGSGGWGNTAGVSVDASGWVKRLNPGEKAGTMMIRDLQAHIPGGTYTVTWEGDGIVDFSMDVTQARQLGAGRAEVDLKPSTGGNNGLYLTVERTNPDDPVRNIRVLMPGVDPDAGAALPFHPMLLSFLAPFGVIRFMDWMKANAQDLPVSWDQRPTPGDRSYAANLGGVPLETMVQLANHVGAAPWFSMYYTATEAYTRAFAQQVKDTLRPDVKVYVEWANEVWHTGFPAGKFAQAEGVRLGYNEEGNAWYGGATNEARLCYYSERTKVLSRVWKDVFGADAARVVVVAQGQGVQPITSDKVLKCRNATSSIDALAIAPYFGSFVATRDTSLDTFMNQTMVAEITKAVGYMQAHAAIGQKYGKPLVAYEGGQGLAADNPFPINANRDGGMYKLYMSYLAASRDAGVTLLNHYSSVSPYSKYGSWGLMEWMDQNPATAPKLQAVKDWIAANASTCAPGSGSGGAGGDSPCPAGCSGHGTCAGTACSCYAGWTGADCSQQVFIDTSTCGYQCTFMQGTCDVASVVGSTRTLACTCSPGFRGKACSIFSCPNDCNWNGACIDKGVCSCYPGYNGTACEIDCGCNGHGVCGSDNKCLCDAGFKLGPAGCEPECDGCTNGAPCIAPGECGCAPACKWGTCYNGRCECFAGYGGAACDVLLPSRPNSGSPIGMNLAAISYWTTEWVFTDVLKHSSEWWTQWAPDTDNAPGPFNTGDTLTVGPSGFPLSLPTDMVAHKLTSRNVLYHAMPGRYVALYDGDGVLSFGFDAKVASAAKGRVEFDFTPTADLACAATGAAYCGDNGIWIVLKATNPANPLRNLRIYQPGFDALDGRQVFHPHYLKSLERYSVLRFAGWLKTNTETLPAWSDRTRPDQDTQSRAGGAAFEHMVRLCNELGAAPWVNVHHLADDAYVRALAELLKAQLRPDMKIYVEHSNEVWNAAFPQGKYAQARGLALGLSTDANAAAYKYHGKRSEEIFDIFADVFGPDARRARLSFVVGTWGFVCNGGAGCGPAAAAATLSYGSVASKADVLAVAPYFDCGLGSNPAKDALLAIEDMLAMCASSLNATRSMAAAMGTVAARFNLTLGTYEAGPSIVEGAAIFSSSETPGAKEKYIALQRDPRFEAVYRSYLGIYDSLGLATAGAPLMHFQSAGLPSKYGSWGLIEYTGQDPATAPKYKALQGFLDTKLPPRASCLDLSKGARNLGDATFAGLPAVMAPAKGAVWVQGIAYNLTFPKSHAPTGAVTVSLFRGTDCGGAAPVFTAGPLAPRASDTSAFEAYVTVTLPVTSDVIGDDAFLRIDGAATGQRNYSDVFSVQRQSVATAVAGCVANPRLPVSQPPGQLPGSCRPELKWNLTMQSTGPCTFEANGCRSYRTSGIPGNWYSRGKPVTDCTALLSPRPSAAVLAAAGGAPGPLVPGTPSQGC